MIYLLRDDEISFPDPRDGEPNGLFAVGGDLSVQRLLLAYSHGIFPWYAFRKEEAYLDLCKDDGEPYIQWWCPMDRFVIFPDEIHISHSMKQMMKKEEYNVTFCQDFKGVITNCGALREKERGAWLGKHIVEAYHVSLTQVMPQAWRYGRRKTMLNPHALSVGSTVSASANAS